MPLSFARARTLSQSALKTTAALASVLTLCSSMVLAQSAASAQSSDAPHLPDMSAYNCATAITDTTAATRHIGQVIKGQYHEWYEFHVQVDGQSRLGCISLVRPAAQQLSIDQAKTFLTNSFAVGAPATASDRETSQAVQSLEPGNVQAEPLKRISPPSASSTTQQKATTSDQAPAPALKNFDDPTATAPVIIKPSKERSSAVQESPDQALAKVATVGVEDRVQVTNTQVYPWTTLAYLSVTYPNGDSYRCSATLVSPYVVVTAGHCVHNNNRGGYISSARIYPGQTQVTLGDNNPVRPYGVKSDIAQVQTTSQWTQISGNDSYPITQYRYDFAAIQLKTAFTHTSTFMPVLYGSTLSPVRNAGYPAQFNNTDAYGLYNELNSETSQSISSLRSSDVREFAIDASPGNSGGPFFYLDTGTNQRYLVGSLSYASDQDDQAGGPWYDSWNQSLISSWVSWTPNSATASTVSGLRVASVFSSAVPSVISYVRFYNAGATSGTVDVTLADYTTGNVLATWTSGSIAGHRTRQFAMSEIEAAASSTFTKPAVYSLSVRPTFTGSFQNTLWNTGSLSLVNASACDTQSTDQKTLIYVLSSMLSPYTSTIVVHNTGATAVTPTLGIYNAETGARLTGYTTAIIPPNGQIVMEVATLEKAANITSTTAFHYNIVAESSFTGYMQQFVNNQTAKVLADMTTACAMSP